MFFLFFIFIFALNFKICYMKRVPLFFRSDEEDDLLSLSSRKDKFGNIFYCVEFPNVNFDSGKDYVMFTHLSSALDFILTNFKA